MPCNLKVKLLKAIKGKLLKSGYSPGENTQYAEKHLELISYQLNQKRIISLIPHWLARTNIITPQTLITLMGFDLDQLVPKLENEKK